MVSKRIARKRAAAWAKVRRVFRRRRNVFFRRFGHIFVTGLLPSRNALGRIVRHFKSTGIFLYERDPQTLFSRLRAPLVGLLGDVYNEGGRMVYGPNGKRLTTFNIVDERALTHLANKQFDNIRTILGQQYENIRTTLVAGVEQGDSIPQITKDLFENVDNVTRKNARRIARTEVIQSHARGMEGAMKTHDLNHYEWLQSGKPNACPVCRKLHGRVMDMRKPEYPGGFYPENELDNIPQVIKYYRLLPAIHTHPNCTCAIIARPDLDEKERDKEANR